MADAGPRRRPGVGVVRTRARCAPATVVALALLVAVLGALQPGPATGWGVAVLVLVAAVVASLWSSAPLLVRVRPGGGAARELGSLLARSRQCEPDAAGHARPRAPGLGGPALV